MLDTMPTSESRRQPSLRQSAGPGTLSAARRVRIESEIAAHGAICGGSRAGRSIVVLLVRVVVFVAVPLGRSYISARKIRFSFHIPRDVLDQQVEESAIFRGVS